MNLENHRLQFLLQALNDNTITKQELDELSALLKDNDTDEAIAAQMGMSWRNTVFSEESYGEDLYSKITSNPRFIAATPPKNTTVASLFNRNFLKYYAAAAVLVCCFLGVYFYKFQTVSVKNKPNNSILASTEEMPENNQVVLTLANGKKVVLDQASNAYLSKDNNSLVSKTKDGQVVYDLSNLSVDGDTELAYSAISTPVGATYQLVLADGTKVLLNAKSSLRFPVAFNKKERNVELKGEGYFEVAHDSSRPFTVSAKDMNVQVLGTHFNVSAYDDDEAVKASLLEGSIKASHKKSALLLKPGQQAVLKDKSGTMSKRAFDVEEEMDWKIGYFIFKDQPISEIMKEISRWYNVEVKFQGNVSNEAFGGKYVKSNSLSELLSSLELTGTVKFKVDGRRVTVM